MPRPARWSLECPLWVAETEGIIMPVFRFVAVSLTACALTLGAAGAQQPEPAPDGAPLEVAPEDRIPEGGIEDEALGAAEAGSVIDVLEQSGEFATLLEAVEAAGLGDVLARPGPITLFAPTDEAFATLPDGTLDSLMEPENSQQLAEFLSYHVVEAEIGSAELAEEATLLTLQGDPLTVMEEEDGVMIDGARIIEGDREASNGVVHVIDAILAPVSDSTRG